MKAINIPVGNIWHLISHLCHCEELGINFKKAFSLLGDKSFRTNSPVGSREQLENPMTLPEIMESTSGQAEVKRPKWGREGMLSARPICRQREPSPQRCSTAQAPGLNCFFPQTVAIIIIKQLTPITPPLITAGDGRGRSSKGKVRSRVAFAYLNLK